MTGMLFEHRHRGHLWRLEVCSYNGRAFANWRKWYERDGGWKPSRDGCTMSLETLWTLCGALMAYHGLEVPDGPEIDS